MGTWVMCIGHSWTNSFLVCIIDARQWWSHPIKIYSIEGCQLGPFPSIDCSVWYLQIPNTSHPTWYLFCIKMTLHSSRWVLSQYRIWDFIALNVHISEYPMIVWSQCGLVWSRTHCVLRLMVPLLYLLWIGLVNGKWLNPRLDASCCALPSALRGCAILLLFTLPLLFLTCHFLRESLTCFPFFPLPLWFLFLFLWLVWSLVIIAELWRCNEAPSECSRWPWNAWDEYVSAELSVTRKAFSLKQPVVSQWLYWNKHKFKNPIG